MYKVKLLNNISSSAKEILRQPDYVIGETIENPDALFVRATDLHHYDFNPELLCIGRAGIGVNSIPLDVCTEKGIVVFNTPGGNANGVKELFLLALGMASRDVLGGMQWVYHYDGSDGPVETRMEKIKKQFAGPEYAGKTLGVIGAGNVGSRVANVALSCDMKVYAYDPYLSADAAWVISRHVFRVSDINDIFKYCDYITLHTPLTDETRNMIDDAAIEKMKNGVRIINLARGEVVNEDAIVNALNRGKVARYVADFPTERLIHTPNAVLTPHLGGTTVESESNCARMAAQEMDEYIRFGNIKNSVNMPTLMLERSGIARICIIHRNLPGMLSKIMPVFSKDGINIENMTNKSRGSYAYSVFDVNSAVDDQAIQELKDIEGVIKVRVLR